MLRVLLVEDNRIYRETFLCKSILVLQEQHNVDIMCWTTSHQIPQQRKLLTSSPMAGATP
jgi:hypothetical protein